MSGYAMQRQRGKTGLVSTDAIPETDCDIAIAGAGLAGGLIALAFARARPDVRLMLVDGADRAGGRHIWSFFDGDVDVAGRELLTPLVAHRWEEGHDVRFPGYERTLSAPYNSVPSQQFDAVLRGVLGERLVLGDAVAALDTDMLILASGRRVRARAIIDARGITVDSFATNRGTSPSTIGLPPSDPMENLSSGGWSILRPASSDAGRFLVGQPISAAIRCGWQKFVGHMLRLAEPHEIPRPVIMDATVSQRDGYRFFYLLPVDAHRVFVEDTYYSDDPSLEEDRIADDIAAHAAARGWRVTAIEHCERGALPVVKHGSFARLWPETDDIARAGVRAGLFHAMTGYSLPTAARFALMLTRQEVTDGIALARLTRCWAERHWRDNGYYRLLATMLFDAAPPDRRYRLFERFYRLSEPLIARFYTGTSTRADKIRILCGRPPVPIRAAMRSLWNRSHA